MAAAVIEALFFGNPDHDFDGDPGGIVLWFNHSPSLNEQTRAKILGVSDQLTPGSLDIIDTSFNQAKLEAGTVYFLNAQKLARTALLVRGATARSAAKNQPDIPMPDGRSYTFWDTLKNTIDDRGLTLYLILDEAHLGMKAPSKRDQEDKATIVQRLVNGTNGTPPAPIVWGISATIDRFNVAMERADSRTNYSAIKVDPVRVQASGLLKRLIKLVFPDNSDTADLYWLGEAATRASEYTRALGQILPYCEQRHRFSCTPYGCASTE